MRRLSRGVARLASQSRPSAPATEGRQHTSFCSRPTRQNRDVADTLNLRLQVKNQTNTCRMERRDFLEPSESILARKCIHRRRRHHIVALRGSAEGDESAVIGMGEKTWPEKPARQGGSRKILGAAVLLPALLGFTSVERAEAGSEEGIPAHLSLAEAEQIFLARGLDLLIAQYGAQGAEGDLRAAGAHPNPGLDFTASFGPRTSHDIIGGTLGPPTGPVNRTLGLAIGLTDNAAIGDQLSGKRILAHRSQRQGLGGGSPQRRRCSANRAVAAEAGLRSGGAGGAGCQCGERVLRHLR